MQLLFNFPETKADFSGLSFFRVITTRGTKQSSSTFCIFFKCLVWIFCLFFFDIYKWYGIGLVFCFIGRCPWLQLYFQLEYFVRFVWNSSPKFVSFLSFSDRSVIVVLLSKFCIVQLNSCNQSIPSNGFMPSRSVISILTFYLIPLLSASAVIFFGKFHSSFINVLIFSCYRWQFLFLYYFFLRWNYGNRWSSVHNKFFSVPSIFTVMVKWFFFGRLCVLFQLLFLSACRHRFVRFYLVP